MLYNLLYPFSDQIGLLNVFKYITFRAMYAFLTALVLSILLGPTVIRWMKRLKFGQYIQEDGPKHQVKAGTPTMGGVLMAISLLVSVLLWGDVTNRFLWLCLFVFLGFGGVGLWDDCMKLRHRENKGLSARAKFLGQVAVAGVAMILLIKMPGYSTELSVPFFKNIRPDLGWLYVPFAILVMVGASNGVNLTDGLDGLAAGASVVSAGCFAIFIYVTGHAAIAHYLQLGFIPGVGEVTVFCGALMGAVIGFLWFNAYPAQIFMGDVGSLSLGGTFGFISILCKQELLLLLVGGLFVIETVSVILQVGYFRFSGGKRIFRMAPLHHHFELKGIPESKIIIRFWILSVLFALAALSTLKLR